MHAARRGDTHVRSAEHCRAERLTAPTKIYLAGGLRALDATVQDTVATFSSYDVTTGMWEALPDLPEARDHVAGAVLNGTFYVIGGRTAGRTSKAPCSRMISPDTEEV